MVVFALASSAAIRAASLNLCTDEYLLRLAGPGQIVSLSYLAGEAGDSAMWQAARRYPRNRGTLESALAERPNLVFTMGGGGRDTAAIAQRLGIRVITLPYPASVADIRRQAMLVARSLRQPARATPYTRALDALVDNAPARQADAAFVSGGGTSLNPGSLGAEWMALAGYRQRPLPDGRLSLETLLSAPPRWLIRSDYRAGQWSRSQAWFDNPLVRRLTSRTRVTDGRAWTCGGLPMIAEIQRLRALPR